MRKLALVLGGMVTASSIYVAQVAVSSAQLDRAWAILDGTVPAPRPDAIWYGGILAPITVEVSQARVSALAGKGVGRAEDLVRRAVAHSRNVATSRENVRTSIGLVM